MLTITTADLPALSLIEARTIIDRAVSKTLEFGYAAAFAVVDHGGTLLSAVSMDGAPASGIVLSRAKAYLAALDHFPTARRNERWKRDPLMFHAYASAVSHPIFPGAGGMPIVKDGVVVGGFSTGPGVGGIDVKLPAYDDPVNLEDYVTAFALEIDYNSQHRRETGSKS